MEKVLLVKDNKNIEVLSTENLEEALKLISSDEKKTVGTHSGVFHCDEVLACSMIKYTNEYRDIKIIRSRNPEIHNKVDVLLDVGGEFIEEKSRFDHHQKSFTGTFGEGYGIKLSSAGLVYKYYGKEIIKNILEQWKVSLEHKDIIYKKLYDKFILEIDAIDNGVEKSESRAKYDISTGLSTRVSRYNPPWNPEDFLPQTFNHSTQFKKAMDVAEEEFLWQLRGIALIWLPAFSLVHEAFKSRHEFHKSGQFIYLIRPCPWKEHLYNVEEANEVKGLIKFVFYKDERGMYRIQAVSQNSSSFSNRVSLCEKWRGLRADELAKVSGYDDMDFVHHSGFIGGGKSLECVIRMGELSLEEASKKSE